MFDSADSGKCPVAPRRDIHFIRRFNPSPTAEAEWGSWINFLIHNYHGETQTVSNHHPI